MEKSKLTVAVAIIILLILGFFGWRMWQSSGVDLSEEEISEFNPFAQKEPANPFQESNTNPYENIKTNPFE
ncbi:MAG: hypothetical protein AAB695_01325 [Patescibacteria group bacterium]